MILWLVLAGYVLASLTATVAYGLDKSAALRGGRRIRERTLHLFEACGGWPGAMLSRRMFRHKTMDTRFLFVSWLIIVCHAFGWCLWLASR